MAFHSYMIESWREGSGDPRLSLEVNDMDGNIEDQVLGEVAEAIRVIFASHPDVSTTKITKTTQGDPVTETLYPAP